LEKTNNKRLSFTLQRRFTPQ